MKRHSKIKLEKVLKLKIIQIKFLSGVKIRTYLFLFILFVQCICLFYADDNSVSLFKSVRKNLNRNCRHSPSISGFLKLFL